MTEPARIVESTSSPVSVTASIETPTQLTLIVAEKGSKGDKGNPGPGNVLSFGTTDLTTSDTPPTENQVLVRVGNEIVGRDDQTASGDMEAATYDPQNIQADAFDRGNQTGTQGIETIAGLDTALSGKSDIGHNHDGTYDPVGTAAAAVSAHDTDTRHFAGTDKADLSSAKAHSEVTLGNPHSVTKSDVGLGNVDNTADADKPISTLTQSALDTKSNTTHNHDGVYDLAGTAAAAVSAHDTDTRHFAGTDKADLATAKAHAEQVTGNPHSVTKADVGLGNVDNTSDSDKPISTLTQSALDDKIGDAASDNKRYGRSNGAWVDVDVLPGSVAVPVSGTVTLPLTGGHHTITPGEDILLAADSIPTAPNLGFAILRATQPSSGGPWAITYPAEWAEYGVTIGDVADSVTEILISGNSAGINISAAVAA